MGKTVTFYSLQCQPKWSQFSPPLPLLVIFLRGEGWMIKYRFVKSLWQKRQFVSLLTPFCFQFFFSPWPRSLFSVCNLNWSPVLVTNVQLVGSTFESTNKKKKKEQNTDIPQISSVRLIFVWGRTMIKDWMHVKKPCRAVNRKSVVHVSPILISSVCIALGRKVGE